jgi:OmcA/MtrC family decaheme c-type cytochrome
MRVRFASLTTVQVVVVLLLLAGSAVLISAPKPVYTAQDKAFYADPNLVDFVRPGLVVSITNAEITADGTIKAWVKFTDPKGLPLDRKGIETPGEIEADLMLATIPAGQTQYRNYITRTFPDSPNLPEALRGVTVPFYDTTGTWEKLGPGEYVYTFGTKAPSDVDRSATHTLGGFFTRDLEEFDLGEPSDNSTFNFVPDRSPVTVTEDVVTTATCNKCHNRLTMHGRVHDVEVCILCHTPQMADARGVTGNFRVMIHKLHAGAELPNADTAPYTIFGTDFSHVEFPADVRRCAVCHDPDSGAKQADAWLTQPSRLACGSCHENVNFATGVNHEGGPQVSDKLCAGCHIPEGELEFDASIKGAHVIPTDSRDLAGVVIDLLSVDNGKAGEKPVVTFSAKDKAGNPLDITKMDRLGLSMIGPTSDYKRWPTVTDDEGRPIREDARQASGGADGRYTYTFSEAVPANATGSWSIGVEARNVVTLQEGLTTQVDNVRDAAYNDLIYFSVDSSKVEPRRTVVDRKKCDACHYDLALHGGNRKNPEYCVFCHRPDMTADETPIDFRMMVHKIHAGSTLERPYVIGRSDYSHVVFPGFLQTCDTCHTGGSQELPLNRNLEQVSDPGGYLNPVGPTAAACLACHDSLEAASHALAQTTKLGESCAACHGPDAAFAVSKVHAR